MRGYPGHQMWIQRPATVEQIRSPVARTFLLLILPFFLNVALHGRGVLRAEFEEAAFFAWMIMRASLVASQISGRWALPVTRPPISRGSDLLLGFTPGDILGGLPLLVHSPPVSRYLVGAN